MERPSTLRKYHSGKAKARWKSRNLANIVNKRVAVHRGDQAFITIQSHSHNVNMEIETRKICDKRRLLPVRLKQVICAQQSVFYVLKTNQQRQHPRLWKNWKRNTRKLLYTAEGHVIQQETQDLLPCKSKQTRS